jgi:hypothetical protein
MKTLPATGLALLLAACAAAKPVNIAVPFDQARARAQLAAGTNTVNGRVLVDLDNGNLVSCANNVVNLVPVTAYAREWARQFYRLDSGRYGTLDAAYRLDSRGPEIQFVGADAFYATTRTTRCDADGEFSFINVANGEFFVIAKTRWLGRDHDYYDFMYGINDAQEEDGSVMKRIRLTGGEVENVEWAPPQPGLLGGQGLGGWR